MSAPRVWPHSSNTCEHGRQKSICGECFPSEAPRPENVTATEKVCCAGAWESTALGGGRKCADCGKWLGPEPTPEKDPAVAVFIRELNCGIDELRYLPKIAQALTAALAEARKPAPGWKCQVREAGLTDPPQDCDWPHCGCDPYANRVLEDLDEQGFTVSRKPAPAPEIKGGLTEEQACEMAYRAIGQHSFADSTHYFETCRRITKALLAVDAAARKDHEELVAALDWYARGIVSLQSERHSLGQHGLGRRDEHCPMCDDGERARAALAKAAKR